LRRSFIETARSPGLDLPDGADALGWRAGGECAKLVQSHVFDHISINNRWERWLVGTADVILRVPMAMASRVGRRPIGIETPRRILLLRLERVGDLIMVLDAISMVRELAPNARIDLVVGTWNEALARLIPDVDTVETLDVPWMARQGHGRSWPALFSSSPI
jgi:hypothetical protein